MGRKKIRIERINDDKNRSVTFNKRKVGLMKKAIELSVLCDCDVAVLVFHDHQLYQFSSQDLIDNTIVRYFAYEGPYECIRKDDLSDLKPGKASSFKVGTTMLKQRRAPVPARLSDEVLSARLVSTGPSERCDPENKSGLEAKVLSVAPGVAAETKPEQTTNHGSTSTTVSTAKKEPTWSPETQSEKKPNRCQGPAVSENSRPSNTVTSNWTPQSSQDNNGAVLHGRSFYSSPQESNVDHRRPNPTLLTKRGRGRPLSIQIPVSSTGIMVKNMELQASSGGHKSLYTQQQPQQQQQPHNMMMRPPMWQGQSLPSPPLQIPHQQYVVAHAQQQQFRQMPDSSGKPGHSPSVFPRHTGMDHTSNGSIPWPPNMVLPMLSPPFAIGNLSSPPIRMPLQQQQVPSSSLSPFGLGMNGSSPSFASGFNAASSTR